VSGQGHDDRLGIDERVPTGIAGLDEILDGGLPAEHVHLLEGDPGAGKTTLAWQFLLACPNTPAIPHPPLERTRVSRSLT